MSSPGFETAKAEMLRRCGFVGSKIHVSLKEAEEARAKGKIVLETESISEPRKFFVYEDVALTNEVTIVLTQLRQLQALEEIKKGLNILKGVMLTLLVICVCAAIIYIAMILV